jgi:hypothetical protein
MFFETIAAPRCSPRFCLIPLGLLTGGIAGSESPALQKVA